MILLERLRKKKILILFIDQYIRYVDKYLYQLFPKTNDAKTADAIMELFRKRETLEIFNKKHYTYTFAK